jgi:phytoene dehydrogenase-like protein
MKDQVIVVGAGVAGLTAAARLARADKQVTVLEKASHPGGRAATRVKDGYHLNLGPHALYVGGAATRLLAELGVSYSFGIPKQVLALDGGRVERYPTDLPSTFSTRLLDARDKLELLRFFATLPLAKASAVAGVDAESWIARTAHRPRVRRLIGAFMRTVAYSAALDLVSAEVLVSRLQLAIKHPVRYVDGGWQTLVDGLRRAAEDAGARVRTGARVEQLETTGQRVTGVWLADGTLLAADAVVVATTPDEALALLGDHPPELRRQLADAPAATVACLDVALDRLPRPRTLVVQDLTRPRFLTIQSTVARIAPPGGAVLHAVKQLDPRQPGDPREDERDLEAFLDELQPGWRDHVVDRACLPRMTAAGLLPTAKTGGFAGRPAPRVPGMDGVYLAGDWVGAEGYQLDAAMASADHTAKLVLGTRTAPELRAA